MRNRLVGCGLAFAVGALLLATAPAVPAATGDWPQFRSDSSHSGSNPTETILTPATVAAGLVPAWTAPTTALLNSSPAVAGGVAYIGSTDGMLYAYDAAGSTNCAGSPKICSPLWTAPTGGSVYSSPAVAGGVAYIGSDDGKLYAFDAAGSTNCAGSPKVCSPLWTAATGDRVESSPTVVGGVAYVGSFDGNLYAFDAAGSTNCAGTPKVCSPLWTAATGGQVGSSPAIAGGVVYVGAGDVHAELRDEKLYAFDAAGSTNCGGTPKVCSPLWTAATAAAVHSSPAVAGGVVYVGSNDFKLYAFDAAGSTNCGGTPKVCSPLWTAATGGIVFSSPAIAGGVVYVGSFDSKLYTFDAAGSTNCAGTPKVCSPLWTGATGGALYSSPAVAGGVAYVNSSDGKLYAFDAAGSTNCAGSPKVCSPLSTGATIGTVASSPAVAGGVVYVGSDSDALYAFVARVSISTLASAGGPVGTAVTDTATVSGGLNPSGTVTFKLFGDTACTAQVGATSTKTLAGRSATSDPITPQAAGTYYWTAAYSGDATNTPASSPCLATNESATITKATPTIATQATATATPGQAISDTATVTGVPGVAAPTGTVTFTAFGPADANCMATAVFTSSAQTLAAGPPPTANSGPFTPAGPGAYRWRAAYSGDANYLPLTGVCNAANESSQVDKPSPTISTQASAGGIVGVPVTDTATVAGGSSPTGNVTFRLFTENTCATQVFASTNALAGGAATSGSFTPAAAGTYYWTAVYNGDANNNTATSACNAPNESVVITPFQAPPYTRTITGDLLGPVTVNAGESVLITSARVVGPVMVNPGGALTVVGSQITKGITATAPGFFSLCATKVAGPTPAPTTALTVTGAPVPIRVGDPASGCAGNQFAGKVVLTGNLAATFGANIVSESATIDNNGAGNTVVKVNTLYGALACAGNNPAPTNAGQTNTAASKTGQCAGL